MRRQNRPAVAKIRASRLHSASRSPGTSLLGGILIGLNRRRPNANKFFDEADYALSQKSDAREPQRQDRHGNLKNLAARVGIEIRPGRSGEHRHHDEREEQSRSDHETRPRLGLNSASKSMPRPAMPVQGAPFRIKSFLWLAFRLDLKVHQTHAFGGGCSPPVWMSKLVAGPCQIIEGSGSAWPVFLSAASTSCAWIRGAGRKCSLLPRSARFTPPPISARRGTRFIFSTPCSRIRLPNGQRRSRVSSPISRSCSTTISIICPKCA